MSALEPVPGIAPRNSMTVKVWDRTVRVLHWSLVLAVAVAWLSTVRGFGAHQPAGYVALGAVLLRLLWGFVGNRHARFAQFVRPPGATLRYAAQHWRGRAPRHLGHNPLGGWMIVALLACVLGLGATGWLYTTDRFWGDAAVDSWHQALAWILLGLATLHVAGVVFSSSRQRENLVASMFSGSKRAPRGDDIG